MNLKLLHIFLLSTAGTFLLCTPFINTVELANGLVTGKMCWFHLAMLFFSVCVFFVMLTKKGTVIAFTFSDPLVLFFAGGVLITYKWNLNPEPEKLIFAGQLVILWFLLRYVLTAYREFKFFFLFVLMFTGLIEAVWGMQQLHGYSHSNHSLFRLTGSFFNRSYPDCPACRNEPVGVDSGGRGLRMGVLDGTDRMGEDESCI